MDANRDAVAGDSGSDDGDEGDGGGTVGLGKLNCNYAGYRYGLSGRWNSSERDCDCELDRVYDGARTGGADRDGFSNDYEWGFERRAGAECRIDSDGDLLYGGV